MIFTNRRYFTKQVFEIQKSSLNIEIKNLFDFIQYEISYEQISNKKRIQSTANTGRLFTSLFCFFVGFLFLGASNDVLAMIFISLAIFFLVFTFSSKKRVITIAVYDGNKLELYYNKRNKQEVIDFADCIIKAANNYLLNKYGKIDSALPIEPQLDNIQFLRNREVISDEDYEDLKNQLLGRKNRSSIGFGY